MAARTRADLGAVEVAGQEITVLDLTPLGYALGLVLVVLGGLMVAG